MLLKLFTYSGLLFSGLSRSDFINVKNKRNLNELVDIHHIIPREFKYHPTILFSEYDIDNGYNLMFLPTQKGSVILNTHKDRPIHFDGHKKYNRYVAIVLDEMFTESKTGQHNLCKLNKKLKQNMRHQNVPWN
tara:strand:- start:2036 stop:2434 length:399 start_codon:yes stop_codon:yes gene_type:complete